MTAPCVDCGEELGERFGLMVRDKCWTCYELEHPDPPPARNGHKPAAHHTPKLRRLDVGKMVREQPPKVDWLVDQLVVSGMLTMLHGREGQGKSMLAMALAAGVVLGEAQAGMACRRGKVVYVDAENGESEIHRRVHTLGLPADVVVVEADGFDLRHDLSQLERIVSEESPDLVVLDSFRSLWRGKEKDDGEVAAALDPLRNLVHRHGFGCLLLHHSRRMDNDYRGSSAIGASTELGFGLGRVEGDPDPARRLLKTTGKCRPAADPPNRWLRLSAERGMVLIDQAEPFESEDAPVGRPPVVSNGIAPKVLEALRREPQTRASVARAIGKDPKDSTFRRVFGSLQAGGEVVDLGEGRWGVSKGQNT